MVFEFELKEYESYQPIIKGLYIVIYRVLSDSYDFDV